MAKRLWVIILTVVFVAAFIFDACAVGVVVDGRTNDKAWIDAPLQQLVTSGDISNSDISYAAVSQLADWDNSIIYLGFRVISDSLVDETTLHGVSVSVNNGESVRISRNSVSEYDTVYYSYTAAVCEYSGTDFVVELALGIKYGIDTVYDISVQFVDGSGNYSNVYQLLLPELPTEESTTAFVTETSVEPTENYTTRNITTTETTQPQTTEKKTTRKTTTKKETTTRKSRTTATQPSTLKITTENQTEKIKTQPATQKETTVKVVTVYVPVEPETKIIEQAEETSASVSVLSQSLDDDGTFKIRKEFAYLAAIVLLIATFGVCAAVNMSYDKRGK